MSDDLCVREAQVEEMLQLCKRLPPVVVAALVLGEQMGRIATALNRLGNGDACTQFGALEALGMAICGEGSVTGTSLAERVSSAITELAEAVESVGEAIAGQ